MRFWCCIAGAQLHFVIIIAPVYGIDLQLEFESHILEQTCRHMAMQITKSKQNNEQVKYKQVHELKVNEFQLEPVGKSKPRLGQQNKAKNDQNAFERKQQRIARSTALGKRGN